MGFENTIELLKKAKRGDKEAKDKLVSLNLGLVWSIVKKFNNRGYELEDLFQVGSIGLLKAIEKFDFSYDVKFSTYAVPMIMGEIRRYIRDDAPVRVARSLKELAYKIQKTKEELTNTLEREPTIKELSAEMGVPVEELIMAMEASQSLLSLNEVMYQDDGSPIYLIDQIDEKEQGQNILFDRIALKEALSKLNKNERRIIILRYFKDMTQVEVAKILNMTQVQVSRLERKILVKVKDLLSQA
ncbi:MAG: RNA polymerase sporulation sigma factor SigF [Tepidanaerobacteraceae bacterium]|jgi:RNA polymerase sporulation-specific sigma factor|nr:RNA polymerase sporulation sigma factor SigF [Tepidanaerobacter sp.]HQA61094.1 RNA polymerase sporulation sigma factor SigF [Tepidanaerobacteraceae bacterium]HQE05850.1 RNA polymerase sporulation sigma factor SigF [Tepidanaerobacteraceae bacterium]